MPVNKTHELRWHPIYLLKIWLIKEIIEWAKKRKMGQMRISVNNRGRSREKDKKSGSEI